jgi:[acyl-carrier-protein] S-malonyltransferase
MLIRVPMIFPGQASQQVGMAADLMNRPGPAGEFLARIDDLLGLPLTTIMKEGPAETLTETRHAQPAILAHSVAVTLELASLGIEPTVVAGHSLGEFSAAVAAGALKADAGLALVRRRGELMWGAGTAQPGTMAAVLGLDALTVTTVCDRVCETTGIVVLANHNSPNQVAISGTPAAVAAAGEALKAAGAKRVIPLNVSGAFHSPLLADAGRAFAEELARVEIRDPGVPLVANVSAQPATMAAVLREGLSRQLTSPVLWHDSMEWLVRGQPQLPRVILEIGPGQVLANLARRTYPEVVFLGVATAEDLATVRDRLVPLLNAQEARDV